MLPTTLKMSPHSRLCRPDQHDRGGIFSSASYSTQLASPRLSPLERFFVSPHRASVVTCGFNSTQFIASPLSPAASTQPSVSFNQHHIPNSDGTNHANDDHGRRHTILNSMGLASVSFATNHDALHQDALHHDALLVIPFLVQWGFAPSQCFHFMDAAC